MSAALIPLHPEATDDPGVLRWKFPMGTLPVTGQVGAAPGALGAMLAAADVVAGMTCAADHVDVTLVPGRQWSAEGAAIRTALLEALEQPTGWQVLVTTDGGQSAYGDDAELRRVACEVIDSEIAALARSHGGDIAFVDARDGVLSVQMSGACDGCPAATATLHVRLEQAVREQYPALREVKPIGSPRRHRVAGPVGLKLLRRRPGD